MKKIFRSLQFWVSLSLVLGALLAVLSMKVFWGEPHKWVGASRDLQLTEQQDVELKELFKKFKKNHKTLRSEIRLAEENFHKSVSDKSKSNDDLEKEFVKLANLRNSMGRSRFEMTLKVREIIGAEKIKKFRFLRRRPKHGRRRGGHLPPPRHGKRGDDF